jgi:putative ABC transport system permease protein
MIYFFRRLLASFRHASADAELTREIDAHLRLLEDAFIAQGMPPEEAHFAARRAFAGQVEQIKERQRDARSFRVLDQWWLDIVLAVRMLRRYPGLTLVSTAGMAVAIAIAVGFFGIARTLLAPSVPLDEGDRIVAVQNWDVSANRAERRNAHDFAVWRDEVTAIEDLGAFRMLSRTLVAADGDAELVRLVEISASAFRVARVPPLLGRHLLDADERSGAPGVIVIGHDVWRTRFHSSPGVIGQPLQIGDATYTIVGVMPAEFRFPVNHQYWIPLTEDLSRHQPRQGPELWVFGRLAPEATIEGAQAAVSVIGERLASASPATHEPVRPRVVPYTYPFTDMDDPENAVALAIMQFLVLMLLVVVCGNVAILVYARTATRFSEIAVRTALGAGRGRIVAQLVVEAFALSLLAAAVAMAVVAGTTTQVEHALRQVAGEPPFWMDFSLAGPDLLYALVLATIGAAIVGVIPALKATAGDVHGDLKSAAAGASAGIRLGSVWTGLIVVQVALAIAFLPAALYHTWDASRHGLGGTGFRAADYLNAQLTMDGDQSVSGFRTRFADRHATVMRDLASLAGATGVTFARSAPGHEPAAWVTMDGVASSYEPDDYRVGAGSSRGHRVAFNRIGVDWLEVFEVPLLAGRSFSNADRAHLNPAVIVNRAFVEQVLMGGQAVGQRLQYVGVSANARPDDVTLERWHEIVGVVEDFPVAGTTSLPPVPKVYHPAAAGDVYPVTLSVRLGGGAAPSLPSAARQAVAAIDPSLQLRDVQRLDDVLLREQSLFRLIAVVLVLLTLSVVVLSAAGIYAMMSCTVEQRRKEVGIRAALGADPRRILVAIFGRAFGQLAIGAAVGVCVVLLLEFGSEGELLGNQGAVVVPVVAGVMALVGLLAAWVPARRGLNVTLSDTLRAE